MRDKDVERSSRNRSDKDRRKERERERERERVREGQAGRERKDPPWWMIPPLRSRFMLEPGTRGLATNPPTSSTAISTLSPGVPAQAPIHSQSSDRD